MPHGPWLGVAGVVIGAVSAVVGIGGGSLTVPLLVSRGVATVRAVGTSSACGVVVRQPRCEERPFSWSPAPGRVGRKLCPVCEVAA